MLDQLCLDGVVVSRVSEHVLFQLDRRFPQSDLEKDDPQRIDVMDLGEDLFRLALPLRVTVYVLGGDEIGRTGRKEGLGSTEVEAQDPRFGEVDVRSGLREEQDVCATEAFVDLIILLG